MVDNDGICVTLRSTATKGLWLVSLSKRADVCRDVGVALLAVVIAAERDEDLRVLSGMVSYRVVLICIEQPIRFLFHQGHPYR
jgi:hypothetical protein